MDPAVRETLELYEAVGRDGSHPPAGLALPTGGALARELGYGCGLDTLPRAALDAFVGAAPVAESVQAAAGEWVVDLGCGSGVDALLLGRRGLRVAALDGAPAMLARFAPETRALGGVALRGLLPELPLASGFAAWVLLNGAANLVHDRARLLAEVHRVLAPGGRLLVADLIAVGELPPESTAGSEAWAWCVGGAALPERWRELLATAGFVCAQIDLLEEFPPLARALVRARKPTVPSPQPRSPCPT